MCLISMSDKDVVEDVYEKLKTLEILICVKQIKLWAISAVWLEQMTEACKLKVIYDL